MTFADVEENFNLFSYALPETWAGADCDECAVKPVIANGSLKTWTVKIDGGIAQLYLNTSWYCTKDGDRVVVQLSPTVPPTPWVRVEAQPEGCYTIQLVGTDLVWTLEPNGDIVLKAVDGSPTSNQLWTFKILGE